MKKDSLLSKIYSWIYIPIHGLLFWAKSVVTRKFK